MLLQNITHKAAKVIKTTPGVILFIASVAIIIALFCLVGLGVWVFFVVLPFIAAAFAVGRIEEISLTLHIPRVFFFAPFLILAAFLWLKRRRLINFDARPWWQQTLIIYFVLFLLFWAYQIIKYDLFHGHIPSPIS